MTLDVTPPHPTDGRSARMRGASALRLAVGESAGLGLGQRRRVARGSCSNTRSRFPALCRRRRRCRKSSTWSTTIAPGCNRCRPRGPRSRRRAFRRSNADIAFQRPRSFRLVGAKFIGPEVDLGSNDELLWFWVKRAQPPALLLLPSRPVRRQRRAADHSGRARVADRSLRRGDVRTRPIRSKDRFRWATAAWKFAASSMRCRARSGSRITIIDDSPRHRAGRASLRRRKACGWPRPC